MSYMYFDNLSVQLTTQKVLMVGLLETVKFRPTSTHHLTFLPLVLCMNGLIKDKNAPQLVLINLKKINDKRIK